MTHLANGPWKKSLNFIFPTKYVLPKSLKFSHWPSKMIISGYHEPTDFPANNTTYPCNNINQGNNNYQSYEVPKSWNLKSSKKSSPPLWSVAA